MRPPYCGFETPRPFSSMSRLNHSRRTACPSLLTFFRSESHVIVTAAPFTPWPSPGPDTFHDFASPGTPPPHFTAADEPVSILAELPVNVHSREDVFRLEYGNLFMTGGQRTGFTTLPSYVTASPLHPGHMPQFPSYGEIFNCSRN